MYVQMFIGNEILFFRGNLFFGDLSYDLENRMIYLKWGIAITKGKRHKELNSASKGVC